MRRAALILVGVGLVSVLAGCTGDPTEGITVVTLQNDLGSGVTLTACDDAACHSIASTVNNHLAPNQTMPANVSTDGVATYYRITADSGGPTRCLALVAKGQLKQKTVPLSSAQTCGRT